MILLVDRVINLILLPEKRLVTSVYMYGQRMLVTSVYGQRILDVLPLTTAGNTMPERAFALDFKDTAAPCLVMREK